MIYAIRCPDAELIMLLCHCVQCDTAVYNFLFLFSRPIESFLRCRSALFYDRPAASQRSPIARLRGEVAIVFRSNSNEVLLCKNRFRSISVGDLRFNLALTTSRRQARLIARPRPIASMKRGVQRILPRSITVDIPNIPDPLSPEIQSQVENMATREQQQSDSFNNLFYTRCTIINNDEKAYRRSLI